MLTKHTNKVIKKKTLFGGTRHKQDYEKNLGYFGPIMDKHGKLDPDEICHNCTRPAYERSARNFCKVHDKIWDPKTNSCRAKKNRRSNNKRSNNKRSNNKKGGKKFVDSPNIPVKIHLEGTNYNGRGNWISSSPNNIYISYHGSKNSGRVYAPPEDYKHVTFNDKNNKVSLTWSGDWFDEDKQKEIFRNKKFTIEFLKDKDYINFKDLFQGHSKQKTSKKTKKKKTKSKDRPSPSESATGFPEGTVKTGNDGNQWIIRQNKKGVKRWVKHDDGEPRGKNKPLEKMWKSLSDGKSVIFIYKNGTHKIIKTKTPHEDSIIQKGNEDNDVKAILTAGNSWDSYRELYSKAKNQSVNHVLKNYKKYFPYSFPNFGSKGFLC